MYLCISGHQDKKVADLQKDVSESPKRDVEKDVKKDVNKQEKPDTTESPKTSEKSKDINTQSKVTPESTKDKVVTATAAGAAQIAKKEEEEDSDIEDTGYCSYCKMEFTSADVRNIYISNPSNFSYQYKIYFTLENAI